MRMLKMVKLVFVEQQGITIAACLVLSVCTAGVVSYGTQRVLLLAFCTSVPVRLLVLSVLLCGPAAMLSLECLVLV